MSKTKCPNKKSPEWIKLVNELGENMAWKVFLVKEEVPEMSIIDELISISKQGEPVKDKKAAFIERANSRIENGMYKEKSGRLVPITDSYNPETWWIEDQEDLVDFDHGKRNEHLFKFNDVLEKTVVLNQKYHEEGYKFTREQVVFPNGPDPSPNSKKIYKIKLTKPLIRSIEGLNTYHVEQDIKNAIAESTEEVRKVLKSIENKTAKETIDTIANLEIEDSLKQLLTLFSNKLINNPTLRIEINNTEENEAGIYDPSTNVITLYTLGHTDRLSSSVDNLAITLAHELIHAFTVRALWNSYTPAEKEFRSTMERLYATAKKQTKYSKLAAYGSVEEFVARIITQPKIMAEAMKMKLSIWERILNAIKKVLGITSVYEHAFKTITEYIGQEDNFEVKGDFEKIRRSLEDDVYLNKNNVSHKEIWDTLNSFDSQFDFDPATHTYTHTKTGQVFNSATEMMQRFRFKASTILSQDPEKAKKQIYNKERGGAIGTIIHSIAEADLKQKSIDILNNSGYDFDENTVSKLEHILRQFKEPGNTILSEVLVADVDLKLAGTIDMVIIDKNNNVHIYDFKNKERGFADYLVTTKYGGSMPMTEKDRHAIQVSLYKDMFEKMTGLNVATLNIVTLKPTLIGNTITNIELDKTHSKEGIVKVDYNYDAETLRKLMRIAQGKREETTLQDDKLDPESRKELDDKLKEKIKDLKDNLEDLSDKQQILARSLDALMHRKDVLYRTGKRHEIGAQERLIDELIDLEDKGKVEEALYKIVDYANKSAFRIYNEYNRYKKEGKQLPLQVLYSWRDSVSAFNALTNEEDGLERVLTKEHGFTGGPEYREILKKTIGVINEIKSLYVAEGLDQLVDFLAPFYNQVYAEVRLNKVKEYRRKKFLGQIKENITESEYVDHAIDEEGETLDKRTKTLLRKELKKASRDIGLLTRWLDNVLDSSDPVTAAMVKAFAFADEDARLGGLDMRDELVSMVRKMEAFYAKQGRIPRSSEEFYGFMLERDEEGKLTGHYITSYTSSMIKEYRDVIAAARDLETQEQRNTIISDWLEKNMPLDKINFHSAYWSYIEQQNSLGYISDDDFTKLEQNLIYSTNKLTVREMSEKGMINFDTEEILGEWLSEHTWDYRHPIDKWVNPQFKELEKTVNDPNDVRGDFYRFILKIRREADSSIPFGFRLDTRLPGVIKQNHERIDSGQSIGSIIRNSLASELTFRVDDTTRIHEELTDESNNPKYFLPVHFTGQVTKEITLIDPNTGEPYTLRVFDPDEQSFDLATIYHKYWMMANDYRAKNEILPKMELARFMINKRETVKRNSIGEKIFRKRGKGNNRDPKLMQEATTNNSLLAQQINDWFLTCVYGVKEKDEGRIGNIDVAKLMNFINKYTSLNLLGMNMVAGTANVILGETLERIESFSREYMNPGDFFYADKFYLKTMKGMIGDIGARGAQGLGTHLVEFFGVFDDYGETDMSIRTKTRELFSTNTLYATSHLGEHYMQTRFLFGMLSNKHAFDNKGKDLGRMLDQYEMINDRLILKKEVDLVKSKWEERDVLEFKSKMRGILSRMHGEYGTLGKVAIQRMAIGRMAYLFRHFIVPGFRRRWGKQEYIERLGQYVEGNYITTGKFIGQVGSHIFGKNLENSESAFFARLIGNLQSFKLSMVGQDWATLTDHEKANVQRTLYEVGFLVLAIVLANVAAGMKPDPGDDDELNAKFWAFVMYQTYRMQNELMFFSPNLTSAMSIMRSPMASMSFAENIITLSGQIFDPFATYQNGAWKGRPKILKTLNNMVPIEKQYFRLLDIGAQLPLMQKSAFGGKPEQTPTDNTTPQITP